MSRLDELALVELDRSGVTRIRRPQALPAEESFRAVSEFDAERSELLLARAAILVEGRTEKLVFPFLYRALGFDADAEGISIVECGGKPNIPVFAEVCNRVGIPYLVVHDRDAAAGARPIATEVAVNEAIERVAGPERTVELARDFEEVARLHGHRHKPERALHWFELAGQADDVPEPLATVVRRTVALARGGRGRPGRSPPRRGSARAAPGPTPLPAGGEDDGRGTASARRGRPPEVAAPERVIAGTRATMHAWGCAAPRLCRLATPPTAVARSAWSLSPAPETTPAAPPRERWWRCASSASATAVWSRSPGWRRRSRARWAPCT